MIDATAYRLGNELAVRLPRIHWATGQVARERAWLPRLAPLLPLQLPVQHAVGEPGAGYPYQWAVYLIGEGEARLTVLVRGPRSDGMGRGLSFLRLHMLLIDLMPA